MARLKPAAKGLIIAAVLAVSGFGLNTYLESRPSQPQVPEVDVPLESPRVASPPQVQESVNLAPIPEPTQEAEPELPTPTSNAGLDALLKGK